MNSFLIAEKFVPKAEIKQVAKAILLSQDIKEESWNGKNYTRTVFDSSQKAVKDTALDNFWVTIIHNWNLFMWDEVQEFAKELLKKYSIDDNKQITEL